MGTAGGNVLQKLGCWPPAGVPAHGRCRGERGTWRRYSMIPRSPPSQAANRTPSRGLTACPDHARPTAARFRPRPVRQERSGWRSSIWSPVARACLLEEKRKNAAVALQKRFNSQKSCYGGNTPEERSQRAARMPWAELPRQASRAGSAMRKPTSKS
jgi:hypothetical protein